MYINIYMGPITQQLHAQITGWRIYSIIAPAVFCLISALLYLRYGSSFASILTMGVIVLIATCISWWHWSLSTMVSMLAIMKDTDDHFAKVSEQLESLRIQAGGKPTLTIVKTIDPTH